MRVEVIAVLTLALTTPALAADLNSFRAQHGRPALSVSATLSGIAYEQASLMAGRSRIDHMCF